MALVIDDPEVDRLALELAQAQRVSVKDAFERALRARLEERERAALATRRAIQELQERVKTYPFYDDRTPEVIIGYDEFGLPR